MEVQPSNHVNWLAFERDTIKFDSDTAFDPNYSYIPLVARGFFGGGGDWFCFIQTSRSQSS